MQLNSVCKVLVFTSTGEDWSLQGRPSGRADWYDGKKKSKGTVEPMETSLELMIREQNLCQFLTASNLDDMESCSRSWHPVSWNSAHIWTWSQRSWRGTWGGGWWSRSACDPTPMRWASQINSNMYALPWPSKHKNQWLLPPSKSPTISLVTPNQEGDTVQIQHTLKWSHPQAQCFGLF